MVITRCENGNIKCRVYGYASGYVNVFITPDKWNNLKSEYESHKEWASKHGLTTFEEYVEAIFAYNN